MHATSITFTSPETPTCEIPSNGVVEISLLPVCNSETSIYTRSSYPEAVSTLHCALDNGVDLHVNERQKIRHYRARSTEEEEEEEELERRRRMQITIFYFARCIRKLALYIAMLYSYSIGNQL